MLPILLLCATVLAASNAAILPVDSSSVSVKQSGQDYSYSIHENRGYSIDTVPVVQPHQVPVVGLRSQQVAPSSGVLASVVTAHAAPKVVDTHPAIHQPQVHVRAGVAPVPDLGAYAVPLALDYVPQGYQYAFSYPHHGLLPYPYSAAAIVSHV